jgi:hypothetical protein
MKQQRVTKRQGLRCWAAATSKAGKAVLFEDEEETGLCDGSANGFSRPGNTKGQPSLQRATQHALRLRVCFALGCLALRISGGSASTHSLPGPPARSTHTTHAAHNTHPSTPTRARARCHPELAPLSLSLVSQGTDRPWESQLAVLRCSRPLSAPVANRIERWTGSAPPVLVISHAKGLSVIIASVCLGSRANCWLLRAFPWQCLFCDGTAETAARSSGALAALSKGLRAEDVKKSLPSQRHRLPWRQ